MAYILHIDTSSEIGILALAKDGKLLAIREQTNARNHAATINNDIDGLLADNNIGIPDIAAFCVNGGPGSYTGLRIGLATAKGYCYATEKPLMMHNRLLMLNLAAIADTNSNATVYMSVLQAREGEYFIAVYDKELNILCEPQHINAIDIAKLTATLKGKICLTGHIDEMIIDSFNGRDIIANDTKQPDFVAWAAYAFDEFNCNRIVSLANAEPFYLKQVYTHKPKNVS